MADDRGVNLQRHPAARARTNEIAARGGAARENAPNGRGLEQGRLAHWYRGRPWHPRHWLWFLVGRRRRGWGYLGRDPKRRPAHASEQRRAVDEQAAKHRRRKGEGSRAGS